MEEDEKSEEVCEILGIIPSALLRFSTLAVSVVSVLLIVLASCLHYPDWAVGEVILTDCRAKGKVQADGLLPLAFVSRVSQGTDVNVTWYGYEGNALGHTMGKVEAIFPESVVKIGEEEFFKVNVWLDCAGAMRVGMKGKMDISLPGESLLEKLFGELCGWDFEKVFP